MESEYTLFNLDEGPIGVFDSGYGGLTILNEIRKEMPQYDYIYLGDNARAPYGTRSFKVVYEFTVQSVEKLFKLGCPLVILGCNTASAKALRSVQRYYLPRYAPDRRVLGVIIPTAEVVGAMSRTHHIGVLATQGTISSESYNMEIAKQEPDAVVTGLACPMWVPIIENGEADKPGADYFVKDSIDKLMAMDPLIDTIILGCTHFPLLMDKIRKYVPEHVKLVPQGKYIARSLQDYLRRHHEMREKITMGGSCTYYTTEQADKFQESAALFLNEDAQNLDVHHVDLRGMI
ncbi:MAG: glutamate racemase [Bacteroidaceae bacterium]|jgi:glutamate racemase|nr:glutamate racemase [Bacteroidaceae bacterium]